MTDIKTPVDCPICRKSLTIIQMQVTKVLEWGNANDEGHFGDNGQGSTDVFCYNCGAKIGHYDGNGEWGLFPDDSVTQY